MKNKTEENELKILGEEKFMENWKETTIDGHSFGVINLINLQQ